jgi:hypothetical protein
MVKVVNKSQLQALIIAEANGSSITGLFDITTVRKHKDHFLENTISDELV